MALERTFRVIIFAFGGRFGVFHGCTEVSKHETVVLVEQEVGRLEITVHNALLMEETDDHDKLSDIKLTDPKVQALVESQHLAEGAVYSVVQDQVEVVVVLERLVQLYNVRMFDLHQHRAFVKDLLCTSHLFSY